MRQTARSPASKAARQRRAVLGDVADLYDGDPDTNFTPGVATIYDGIAPLVTDADGNSLLMLAAYLAEARFFRLHRP